MGGLALGLAGSTFAIARILGAFGNAGGDTPEAARRTVQVLKRPLTANAFRGLIMMGMMTVLAAATLHVVWEFDLHTAASAASNQPVRS